MLFASTEMEQRILFVSVIESPASLRSWGTRPVMEELADSRRQISSYPHGRGPGAGFLVMPQDAPLTTFIFWISHAKQDLEQACQVGLRHILPHKLSHSHS